MKIGVLGAGNVGGRLAALLENAGHDVVTGSRSGAHTIQAAAAHGDVVIVAIHYSAVADVLPGVMETLDGKILVDATNPLNDDWSPLLLGQETSAAEEIARLVPKTKVVKAFNTIFADVMTADRQNRGGSAISAFIASDHEDARETAAQLAADAGFQPIRVKKLAAARYLEAMAHLNIQLAVAEGGGTDAAFIYHRV